VETFSGAFLLGVFFAHLLCIVLEYVMSEILCLKFLHVSSLRLLFSSVYLYDYLVADLQKAVHLLCCVFRALLKFLLQFNVGYRYECVSTKHFVYC
jgi:hypothetical protein